MKKRSRDPARMDHDGVAAHTRRGARSMRRPVTGGPVESQAATADSASPSADRSVCGPSIWCEEFGDGRPSDAPQFSVLLRERTSVAELSYVCGGNGNLREPIDCRSPAFSSTAGRGARRGVLPR